MVEGLIILVMLGVSVFTLISSLVNRNKSGCSKCQCGDS